MSYIATWDLSVVSLTKASAWTGCGHPDTYEKPYVFGWHWSDAQTPTLQTAHSYAGPLVAPIGTQLLAGLLPG